MACASVFGVGGFATGFLQGGHHVSAGDGGHYTVQFTMKNPDGYVHDLFGQIGLAMAAMTKGIAVIAADEIYLFQLQDETTLVHSH